MADQSNEQLPMLSGAQALIKSLEKVGVEVIFCLPGGAALPIFDALYESPLKQVLVRHEQGAGHAAEGYALATGRVGVAIVTSGPGATNVVTALADAYMDSVPMVVITGQVAAEAIGTDAFQEADIRGITMPITKHNFLVKDAEDIPEVVKAAFHIASTGRPGPVLIDVAKNAQNGVVPFDFSDEVQLPGYKPTVRPHNRQIEQAADLICDSTQPVLYIGGGVVRARAWQELKDLAELTGIPVVTTLPARGVFPDEHPLCLGMPGMHGTVPAVGAMQRSDLLIAVGTRFDDRVTGALDSFAPNAKVIHADIDPAEIGKNRAVDVPVVGDAKMFLGQLLDEMRHKRIPDYSAWVAKLNAVKERYPMPEDTDETGNGISPQKVIKRIGEISGPETIFVTGVGQHQMWSAHFLPFAKPAQWMTSSGLGTMGYCVPATMGAKVGAPNKVVWGIDGDGSFQMTNQELVTCALNGIPIKIAIINNNTLGMVRQWQTLFFNQHYSNTEIRTDSLPNFPMLAQAMGCAGLRATTEEELDEVIKKAMEINDRPVVVEFVCKKDSMVWPMVAAGTSNDEIKVARDMAPDWED